LCTGKSHIRIEEKDEDREQCKRRKRRKQRKAKMVERRWIENQRPIHVSVANAKPFGATSRAKTRCILGKSQFASDGKG
jgi:hypothetical protein